MQTNHQVYHADCTSDAFDDWLEGALGDWIGRRGSGPGASGG
jgi:hypothetical protein